MSRDFLWWAWDDTQTPPRRGAVFADYDRNVAYVCHYQDELPCPKCKGEPFKIKSAKDYRAEERERIIKLLENDFYEAERKRLAHPYSKPMLPEQWAHLEGIEAVIALIKGEQNV